LIIEILVVLITIISLILPTMLDGVERKIKAVIQSRIGPSILQSWYDILKLFGKELFLPYNSIHSLILIMLYLAIQVFLLVYTVISTMIGITPYDLIIIIALFIITQTIYVAIPFTISNPFSIIGASREIVLILVNELFYIILLGLYVVSTGSTNIIQSSNSLNLAMLVLIASLFINSYVASGRLPFDIAEAEPEIASGIMIELSGPVLGLMIYTNHLKRFFVKYLPTVILLSFIFKDGLTTTLSSFIATILIWILYSIVSASLGRSRVDLAPITLLKIYIGLTMLFIIVSVIGV